MRSFPPEVILAWPTPNYVNPVTRGNALLIVNSIFITIATVVVGLRLYTRIRIKRWFGSDDAFILLALIFTIGLTATVLLANQEYGWDRHVYDIPFTKLAPTSKIAMAAKVIFVCAATFTRLSLLFFYYRLVEDSGKLLFLWTVHANVAFSVGIFISFIPVAIWQCNPVSNYWTFGAVKGSCMNEGVVTLIVGIINCTADLFCTITPIPMVLNLHMPIRQRIAVGLLFSLGFIVTIAGIVRTWYIYKSLIAEYDQTWFAYPLWIAAAVEIDLGVICASAPALRPLFAQLPFSLSSITFSATPNCYASKGSKLTGSEGTAQQSNASRNKSTQGSTQDPKSATNTSKQGNGKEPQYELETWVDVERGNRTSTAVSHSSQDAILRDDEIRVNNVRATNERVEH